MREKGGRRSQIESTVFVGVEQADLNTLRLQPTQLHGDQDLHGFAQPRAHFRLAQFDGVSEQRAAQQSEGDTGFDDRAPGNWVSARYCNNCAIGGRDLGDNFAYCLRNRP